MKTFLKISLLALFSLSCIAATSQSSFIHAVRTLALIKIFPPSVVEVGDNMVDAKLFDIDGNKKQLSDYLSNKYLLLTFGSYNCGVFEMSLPEMKEVSEIYCDKLTIINVNLDSKPTWKKAMTKQNFPWINVRDPKSHAGLAGKYGNGLTVPYYVIISPEGKILDKWHGYTYIKEKVNENILNKITLIQ